jgi:regulator of sigma E protease
VLRFSVGFGSPLCRWYDKQGTEYVIAAIPLGGYVKMLDEREANVPEHERAMAFNNKPVGQRLATVAAGPAANFLLAIMAYWLVFASGVTGVAPVIDKVEYGSVAELAGLEPGQEIVAVDGQQTPTWDALHRRLLDRIGESGRISFTVKYPESSVEYQSEAELDNWLAGDEVADLMAGIGIVLYRPQVLSRVDKVVAGGAAEQAGLLPGDLILRADGHNVEQWSEWVEYVRARPGQSIALELERGDELLTLALTPVRKVDEQGEVFGQVGVSVVLPEWPETMIRHYQYGPLEAIAASLSRTWEMTVFTLESIKKMLTGLISHKNLSGPITIAKVATASANSGFEAYVGFLALLSISLGVLNLLPIPVLDGGHILYGLVELATGKPVPEKVQVLGYQIGFFVIIGVMMLALYNDITRL